MSSIYSYDNLEILFPFWSQISTFLFEKAKSWILKNLLGTIILGATFKLLNKQSANDKLNSFTSLANL